MVPAVKPHSPPAPWEQMAQARACGRDGDWHLCISVVFKNLTHFCHVLVHQNSEGGGSVKNVLTCNFVTVPVSLGLLPLPQASTEEPPSPSVPESLLSAPPNPSILPSFRPSVRCLFSQLTGRENQRKQLRTPGPVPLESVSSLTLALMEMSGGEGLEMGRIQEGSRRGASREVTPSWQREPFLKPDWVGPSLHSPQVWGSGHPASSQPTFRLAHPGRSLKVTQGWLRSRAAAPGSGGVTRSQDQAPRRPSTALLCLSALQCPGRGSRVDARP